MKTTRIFQVHPSYLEGKDKVVAVLGPGGVVGSELLLPGNTSLCTARTTADSLLWSLTRDTYQTYLTVCVLSWVQSSSMNHRKKLRSSMISTCSIGSIQINYHLLE